MIILRGDIAHRSNVGHLLEALIQCEWIDNRLVSVRDIFEYPAFGVNGFIGRFHREISLRSGSRGNPRFADNHLSLSQSTGLVGTDIPAAGVSTRNFFGDKRNVRDTTKGFKGIKATDNDAIFCHSAGTSRHGDGQDGDKPLRNDGNGEGDSVNGDLFVNTEPGGTKNDDCEAGNM